MTRRALVIEAPGSILLEERTELEPGPGEVLIRSAWCGLCGTDLELLRGEVDPAFVRYPLTLGHEFAGTIVETMSEARPPSHAGLPQLPGSPSRHAVPTTPMDRNGCVCRLLPRSTRAFPVTQAGRRPRLHFRGLLRLHSRYGLPDRSTAQGGLCHEASTRPVTRPSRSSATRVYRQLPGWILPPLVNRAVGAH